MLWPHVTTCSKGHVKLRLGAPSQVWWSLALWQWNYVFKLPRDLARPGDSRTVRIYRYESLEVNHLPAKFGGHRHCGRGDVFSLPCYFARSHDQMVTWLYGWGPVMVGHHPAKFGGYRISGSEDMFWFCHVISQTHVSEESWHFTGRSQSR